MGNKNELTQILIVIKAVKNVSQIFCSRVLKKAALESLFLLLTFLIFFLFFFYFFGDGNKQDMGWLQCRGLYPCEHERNSCSGCSGTLQVLEISTAVPAESGKKKWKIALAKRNWLLLHRRKCGKGELSIGEILRKGKKETGKALPPSVSFVAG